jgi:hypothetical protein
MFERFMKRTDWYYEEQLYDTSHSTDPTGAELDIDRLVNGNPAYWKTQIRCPTTPRKKKLVITDWRNTKREYFFGGLMDEGFELYVCQGTAIKLTSKNELRADLANLVKVNPTPKKEVIQIMANHGVPADHVLVLDYFLANQLAYTDIQEPLYIIDFSDLANKNDEFYHSILDSIEGRVGIIMPDSDDVIEKYLKQFIMKFEHISYLFSNIDAFEHLFTSVPNLVQTLESLKIYTRNNSLYPEFIKELINLRELDLDCSSIIAKSLKSLLVSCPHLEKLVLNHCKNINDSSEEFFLDENLRDLKDLDLGYSSITIKFLNNLLAHCPNLVSLKLWIINSGSEELQFSNLEKLKELELSGSITTKFFNSLLAHCPNLEKLNLTSNEIINDSNEEIQFENLKNLKELVLGNLSIKFLNSLPAHCPNLIKLSLRSCENINDSSEELQLNVNLKELDLMFSSITMKSLNRVLACYPNLVKLDLSSCHDINDINEAFQLNSSEELQLNVNLKELYLMFSSITMKSLNRVLACYPNLVKLDLSDCHDINDINEAFQLNKGLKELKELNFKSSEITTNSLIRLLVYCPNLETLDLTYCFGVKIDDPLLKKALANIKNVILPNLSSINSSSYGAASTSTGPRVDNITTQLPSRYRLDKNTQYKKQIFEVNQYFLPKSNGQPDPASYRLQVLNHIEKKNNEVCLDTATEIFEERKFETISIDEIQEAYHQQYENKPDYFYGQINLSLAKDKKYALPSLSTTDEIKYLSSNVPVDLWYCQAENLYYVSLQDGNQNATISYIVHTPTQKTPHFPEHIKKLIEFYHFRHPIPILDPGKLKGIDDNSSDSEILNAIKKQRKGSCRHRTLALITDIEKMSTTEKNDLTVRAVFNDCHAYPEVSYDGGGHYYRADLGGYKIKLNVKPLEKLNNKTSDPQNEKTDNSNANDNVQQPMVALQLHFQKKKILFLKISYYLTQSNPLMTTVLGY